MKQWNLTYNKTIKRIISISSAHLNFQNFIKCYWWKFGSLKVPFFPLFPGVKLGLIYSSNKWPKFGQYVIEIMNSEKSLLSIQTLPLAMVLGQCRLISPPLLLNALSLVQTAKNYLNFPVFSPIKSMKRLENPGSQGSRSTSDISI